MDKRPLVLWSGGFDSTALVIEKLKEGDIDIMYVNLKNNEILQRYEKKAILKLETIIRDANLKGRIREKHSFGYEYIDVNKSIYAQPALWVNAVIYLVDPKVHSEVAIAWVRHDDTWHYKTEILNVYDALCALVCSDQEQVPLKFPFEWFLKTDLLENLKEFVYSKEVLNLVYYCEHGQRKPCGECSSCKHHISELGKPAATIAVDMTEQVKQKYEDDVKETV